MYVKLKCSLSRIGFIYKEVITKEELEKLKEDYFVFSNTKIEKGKYDKEDLAIYMEFTPHTPKKLKLKERIKL